MPPRSRLALLAALLFVPAARADGATSVRRPLTVEDLWRVQRLARPALSPDGRWCAVEVTTYDLDKNDGRTELWLLATDGRAQRQLTTGGKSHEPRWSPDGRSIAFVAKRQGDDTAQIYLISPEGGEPRRLTKMPMAPFGLKWSADGRTVYCVASTWPDTPTDAAHKQRTKERADNPVKAFVIDDAAFRYWDHWTADGQRPYVWAVDTATGQHRNLLAGTGRHLPHAEPAEDDYAVSPDGTELCFVSESVKVPGTDVNHDLYALALDKPGAKPRNLTEDNPAQDLHPVYSPDGKFIAFLRQTVKFFYADRKQLMVLDRASGKLSDVTPMLDRSAANPVWMESHSLLIDMEDRGLIQIWSVSISSDGRAKGGTRQTNGCTDRAFQYCRASGDMVFLQSSFDRPATVRVLNLTGGSGTLRRIDHFNDDLVTQWKLGKVEGVMVPGAGDTTVQAWVVYPPDFDPAKKWPLVQVVHGGPHSAVLNDFNFRWNLHLWAAQGWVVAAVNFHGSTGFGQAFTDSITGDLGTKPAEDILKATEWLAAKPYIDRNRVAAAGASYGGYLMAWLNGHTDRFKAMVCHAGVYNLHGMLASDTTRSRERAMGALPWGDLAVIDRQSPQRFAAKFRTPTLVLHGERDFRVPLAQGLEYYNTLRLKGVPTRLVYFPDEGHWVLKPQNSRLWHREAFAWLARHIGRGPTPSKEQP
jgi:dipeptidyl aminopeptidase/acylaminoacyl peptidase